MSTNRRIAQVTQATSKTTEVNTARCYDGIIETVSLTDAADASFVFTVNNSVIQNVSTVLLTTEYPALNGFSTRTVTLTGTSGTANITVGGTNYLATFTSNLNTSATNFVTTHSSALATRGITVTANSGVLTFSALTASFPTIARTNVSGDLSGTIGSVTATASTGVPNAQVESYAKGYFKVRVTNIGTAAFNGPVKLHYKITHN
jgi:hypothetical protein